MGMFDYIHCLYPLPDDAPEWGWQTKDTPSQYLETYVITEDGRLLDSRGNQNPFHGDITFYHSNVTGVGPRGYMTSDNNPYRGWEFTARFTDGRLTSLTGGLEVPEGVFAQANITREEFWGDV